MSDPYLGMGDDLQGPARRGAAVTPDDNADLPTASKRLWIGGLGDVALVTVGGDSLTYHSVPAGSYLQVRAARVKSTGTTATNIVAEY